MSAAGPPPDPGAPRGRGHGHDAPYAPPGASRGRPAVIAWFRVYAVAMAAVYVAAAAMLFLVPIWRDGMPSSRAGLAAVATLLGLVAGVHLSGAFVPYKPWGWTLGLTVLGIGVMSWATVLAIPLLVHWLKPTTKAAFGRL